MSYEKQTWATGDTISGAKLNHIEEGVEGINMSYEKTTWQSGDTITAEKLNNIEDGIAGAGGGDITTAQVTLINNSTGAVIFNMPTVDSYIEGAASSAYVEPSETVVATALLYKGVAFGQINETLQNYVTISATSGDVEVDELGFANITGDCSLTFANK